MGCVSSAEPPPPPPAPVLPGSKWWHESQRFTGADRWLAARAELLAAAVTTVPPGLDAGAGAGVAVAALPDHVPGGWAESDSESGFGGMPLPRLVLTLIGAYAGGVPFELQLEWIVPRLRQLPARCVWNKPLPPQAAAANETDRQRFKPERTEFEFSVRVVTSSDETYPFPPQSTDPAVIATASAAGEHFRSALIRPPPAPAGKAAVASGPISVWAGAKRTTPKPAPAPVAASQRPAAEAVELRACVRSNRAPHPVSPRVWFDHWTSIASERDAGWSHPAAPQRIEPANGCGCISAETAAANAIARTHINLTAATAALRALIDPPTPYVAAIPAAAVDAPAKAADDPLLAVYPRASFVSKSPLVAAAAGGAVVARDELSFGVSTRSDRDAVYDKIADYEAVLFVRPNVAADAAAAAGFPILQLTFAVRSSGRDRCTTHLGITDDSDPDAIAPPPNAEVDDKQPVVYPAAIDIALIERKQPSAHARASVKAASARPLVPQPDDPDEYDHSGRISVHGQ